MALKHDTEYIFTTGHALSEYGTITITSVVELVRCGECNHYDDETGCCNIHWKMFEKTYYCANGERRSDNDGRHEI